MYKKEERETCTRRGLESADQSVLLHRSNLEFSWLCRVLYITNVHHTDAFNYFLVTVLFHRGVLCRIARHPWNIEYES